MGGARPSWGKIGRISLQTPDILFKMRNIALFLRKSFDVGTELCV